MTPRKPNLHWAHPETQCGTGTGVVILSGSSGRLDVGRADMFARHGATALAVRWFGGEGQPSVPCEIPLETFIEAVDLLAAQCDHLALLGLSYGAEGALLTASIDLRVDTVVALAPTDVVWEGDRQCVDGPRRSKWTYRSAPIPFVPLDRGWKPSTPAPPFIEWYERSRVLAGADVVKAATIPVDRIAGSVILVAGGDDKVWPSSAAARQIADHRRRVGLNTIVIEDRRAGHPVVLPGEDHQTSRRAYQVGGDPAGALRLGHLAWLAIRSALQLAPDPTPTR